MSAFPNGARSVVRTFAAVALALALGTFAGSKADASTGLDGLRLFATPERRAALDATDGGEDGPGASEAADAGARSPEPSTRARAIADDREATAPRRPRSLPEGADRLPAGSAVLRSARGVSRIVDGVPVQDDRP